MNFLKLGLAIALSAAVIAAPALAETKKPKAKKPQPDTYMQDYVKIKKLCEKKYGNGGYLRVVKRGDKWWCYTMS